MDFKRMQKLAGILKEEYTWKKSQNGFDIDIDKASEELTKYMYYKIQDHVGVENMPKGSWSYISIDGCPITINLRPDGAKIHVTGFETEKQVQAYKDFLNSKFPETLSTLKVSPRETTEPESTDQLKMF